ncbi:hypothetical protein [Pedobacter sp. L105]|uniref:hypothetical protein n=1 Tax=Pedobacter sp. L105 TaxID=1641871 RepID=UPI00131B7BF3|nr:hypothetical protein [Pedobacter sp. L105]
MVYNKEKIKLKNILNSTLSLDTFEEEQMEVLNEIFREYSTIINFLYKKHPNVFANQYKRDLQEIKENKMFTKKSYSDAARIQNFVVYKDSVAQAIESTLEYLNDYIHQ